MTPDSTPDGVCEEYPNATHVRVTFYPQLWVDDRAVTGTDTRTYLVPLEKALTDDGELVADNTGASDWLARVKEAPDRARNWDGPFYVTLDELVCRPDSEREDEMEDRDGKTQSEAA
jgi:hypothetical protein